MDALARPKVFMSVGLQQSNVLYIGRTLVAGHATGLVTQVTIPTLLFLTLLNNNSSLSPYLTKHSISVLISRSLRSNKMDQAVATNE